MISNKWYLNKFYVKGYDNIFIYKAKSYVFKYKYFIFPTEKLQINSDWRFVYDNIFCLSAIINGDCPK